MVQIFRPLELVAKCNESQIKLLKYETLSLNNLRFSVNRRQIAMLIFGLLILSLLTLSTNALKDNAKSYDETIFSAENSATSIDLVQRESLALTTRFAQWRAGEI